MNEINRQQVELTEQAIDDIVSAQADNDAFWEEPIHVQRNLTSLSIPADLATRAAFLAQLHRAQSLNDWIVQVVRERVEIEEAAFTDTKRAMVADPA